MNRSSMNRCIDIIDSRAPFELAAYSMHYFQVADGSNRNRLYGPNAPLKIENKRLTMYFLFQVDFS